MWTEVVVVGAGAAGLSAAACLTKLSIDYIVLEKDNCAASLWRNRAYDRLHLHLANEFCELIYKPHSDSTPTFLPKAAFLAYIDDYISEFDIRPIYNQTVERATYDRLSQTWTVRAHHTGRTGEPCTEYRARFLVIATGENAEPSIPDIPGLDEFSGEVIHSSLYKNGEPYRDRRVLVVGSGNSGMEIAFDLSNHNAKSSIVVRNPVHILTREVVSIGMHMRKYNIPVSTIDTLLLLHAKFTYGDLTPYGLPRPADGPFFLKETANIYPIIDVGTVDRIKSGRIQVYPGIKRIQGNKDGVEFEDSSVASFDALILATGYHSSVKAWLQDDDGFFGEDGFPTSVWPSKWKGNNGLYCVGLERHGFYGIASDAENVAHDIYRNLIRSADSNGKANCCTMMNEGKGLLGRGDQLLDKISN